MMGFPTSYSMLGDVTGVVKLLFGASMFGIVYVLCQYVATHVRRRKIISKHGCRPPPSFPRWDPIFGLDIVYQTVQFHKGKRMLSSTCSAHEAYGMTYLSRLGTVPSINTIQPENIKAVLSTNFKDFVVGTPRRRAFSPIIANSVLVADGVGWEHSRAFLKPSFSRSQVGDLETLETHVKHLIDAIPGDGSTVDLAELFLRFTADVTTDLMFGESILSLPHPEAFGGSLTKASRDVQIGVERRFILGSLVNFMPQRAFYRSVGKIHAYVEPYVDKALQQRLSIVNSEKDHVEDSGKHVFLRELVKLTDDRLILRDELLGIFFAGRDTTAALLSNFFFILARNFEVWQRLQKEIASLEGNKPTLDELKKLKYLVFCLHETLRLYPVVIGTSRVAINDVILPRGGGDDGTSPVYVSKGTIVMIHFHVLHKRKDFWGPDADEFRPERWQDEIAPWIFVPFGGGPRNCIGQQFALTEASYTAVRLIQEFSRIESRDTRPWTEHIGATCSSEYGVQVALER